MIIIRTYHEYKVGLLLQPTCLVGVDAVLLGVNRGRWNPGPGSVSRMVYAAPTPLCRIRHHASAHRIEHDIACEFQKMRFARHEYALEPPLE